MCYIARKSGFSYADLAVPAITLDQGLPNYVVFYVAFVPSPAASPAAMARA
jgi:hypothetical protein